MKNGISMLYAEDDAEARALLERFITRKFPDLPVYVAADGEQGMALFEQHRPELILTDVVMPGMDGIEMIKRIREINPNAYVIAVTAYNDAEFNARTKELRLDQCVTKPVDFSALLQLIKEAIETRR